jgi:hypothetical protein
VSAAARFSGIEARRSTRIDYTVPLIIVGQTKLGLSFQERTSAVSLNLHGCRYPSRHDYSVGSWVGLQVLEPSGEGSAPVMRAQVRSIHPPMSPRELYQIGVELEAPANVWGVSAPPEDWQRLLGANGSKMHVATGVAPAREPGAPTVTLPQTPAAPEYRSAGIAAFPAPPLANAKAEAAKEAVAAKPERVVITSDQLIAAVQGKLQQAAEKAVQTAVATQLNEAVRQALTKIDDVGKATAHQMQEHSTQHLETMMNSAKEEVLRRMDARLEEDHSRWEEKQEAHRKRTEEVAQQLEKLVADTRRDLSGAQELVGGVHELEPKIRGRLDESVGRAAEAFEAAATQVSDRQLVRLMEDKAMVTREATSQMGACAAEMRALLQSSANSTLEEFRRQMEVRIDLALSEATQRVISSLASLDAENRAACEARRRSIETDVARATEQSTEQFRTGIKAFLYSCLVAAVGAVDEHATTTLDGLVKDHGKAALEIGGRSGDSSRGEIAAAGDGDSRPQGS